MHKKKRLGILELFIKNIQSNEKYFLGRSRI